MTDISQPILFHQLLKPRVWGGRTLERLGKALPPDQPIGESWELADLPAAIPDGRNLITSPPHWAGRTLREVMSDARARSQIMGDAALSSDGGFPLLIKYLDAQQNLSVQVHPSIDYARRHPEAHVKSEAWVVIDAEPGAVIYKGLKPDVSREAFAAHIADGSAVNDLIALPVKAGDCHYLPSGVCHALGAGVLVAEVQTPSDTTFRVFDWGRPAADGRQLHIEQALQCINFEAGDSPPSPTSPTAPAALTAPTPHMLNRVDGIETRLLARTEFFDIEGVECDRGSEVEFVTNGLPQVWMMVSGSGVVSSDAGGDTGGDAGGDAGAGGAAVEMRPGLTMLIPASARNWRLAVSAPSWLLCVRLPSSLKNMIA